MANTLILIDRRDDPWKKVNATIVWKGGGYDHVWIDDSGRGSFGGTGTVLSIKVAGEEIPVYKELRGDTTFVAKSENSH